MPFCTKCGQQVGTADAFCANCGAASSNGSGWGPGNRPKDFAAGLRPRTAAALCYLPTIGWIASLYVLATDRFRNDLMARFHAFQGLYLFVAWLLLDWVIGPLTNGRWGLTGVMKGLLAITGIVMLVKTLHNQDERLPIVGDLADRSVHEQR